MPGKLNEGIQRHKTGGFEALPAERSGIIRSLTNEPPSDAPGHAGDRAYSLPNGDSA